MSKPIGIATRAVSTAAGAAFVLSWASGFVVTKLGVDQAAPTTVLMWRFLPLGLVLAPLVARSLAGPSRRHLGRQVLIGALSQSGYLLAVYGAIGLGVSTGATSLMDGVQPLVVAVLAGPLLGLVVRAGQWLALVAGLGGVGLVTLGDWSGGSGAPAGAYVVPLLGMAALVAATFVERAGPASGLSAVERLAVHCTTSAVVFTCLAVVRGQAVPPTAPAFWWALAVMIAVPTLLAYGLYWWLLEREGITAVNSLMFLVPPVTTVWGALAFGEPVTPLTVAGLALALVATAALVRTEAPGVGVTARPGRSSAPAHACAHPPG